MSPPHTRLDPKGYYRRLGLNPSATAAEVVAAFRGKARLLHPDVPRTGNAEAFVAVKQAYDELSNRKQRDVYDRRARENSFDPVGPEVTVVRRPDPPIAAAAGWQQRFLSLPLLLWGGLGAFLCLGVFQVVTHLLAERQAVPAGIRPNAASVEPLSPSAHQAVLYGPPPAQLPGTPNFYVKPGGGQATLWFLDPSRKTYVSLGTLPPFSTVQAVRLITENNMFEVLLNNHGNGFIKADRLAPGNADAAHQAYCGYNAGTTPYDGELLAARGGGSRTLEIENRALHPTVVKLRDATGAVALSLFLGPGGRAEYDELPDGAYRAEIAVGEVWSRACNTFAIGARARRMDAALRVPGDARLVVVPDAGLDAWPEISEQAFERD